MEWLLIIHSLTWSSLFPFYHIMGSVQTTPSHPYLCNFWHIDNQRIAKFKRSLFGSLFMSKVSWIKWFLKICTLSFYIKTLIFDKNFGSRNSEDIPISSRRHTIAKKGDKYRQNFVLKNVYNYSATLLLIKPFKYMSNKKLFRIFSYRRIHSSLVLQK